MITGTTKLYGVIADPVAHVAAPELFTGLFAEAGIDAVLVPFHISPENLAKSWIGLKSLLNLQGFLITIPHKPAALALCDHVLEPGRQIGAINIVRRCGDGNFEGTNFDGAGFIAGLRWHGFEPRGTSVCLLGAGGAARAIAFALAETGIATLNLRNRSRSKAEDLAESLTAVYPDLPVTIVSSEDNSGGQVQSVNDMLIVNATSLGLHDDDALPLPAAALPEHGYFAEIIINPAETKLMCETKKRGLRSIPGRAMLEGQQKMIMDFFGLAS